MKPISLVLAALALTACGRPETAPVEAGSAAAAPVAVARVNVQNWPSEYQATGTVRARTTAVIASKIMGYVQQVYVQVGDRVAAGQPLVSLDSRDLETNLGRAEAALREAQSGIPEADSGVAAATASLGLAQVTFRRIQDLADQNSVSKQEFDEASARLQVARAQLEMARAKRAQIDARIAQAEQEQQAARILLGYAGIAAPFAGVVTAKTVDPGSLAAPGAPLLTVEGESGYRLEVEVEESRSGAVRVGAAACVRLDALDTAFEGRVSEAVPAVDPASRAYTVKIDLPSSTRTRSGMFGNATFSLGQTQVLVLPASALQTRGQLQSVLVVENGVARTRLVTTGRRSGGSLEVLSGLAAGEQVVTAPGTLADGGLVEPRP